MSSKYWKEILIICSASFSQSSLAIDYDIGPNQSLTTLDEVPWLDLQAGDHVNIHYRAEPYRSKIGLYGRGTEQAPIVIRGIKGTNGELPTLSGENATTPTNLNSFFQRWDENLSVILIKRNDRYGAPQQKAAHINIENLKVVGGTIGNTFTNSAGNIQTYHNAAGGIWAKQVDNLTIRGSELTNNGHGLFVLSNGGELDITRNVLIENNQIHGNGVSGSNGLHNIYTSAANITIQNNEFGKLRDGSTGAAIKDRSSGTIIRDNRIETGTRVLDLVDPGRGGTLLTSDANYNDTYVQNNLIIMDRKDALHSSPTYPFHYGGDSGHTDAFRNGTLHFTDNTVFINSDKSSAWEIKLFELNKEEGTVELINNNFHLQGDTNLTLLANSGLVSVADSNRITTNLKNGVKGDFADLLNSGFVEGDLLEKFDLSQFDPLLNGITSIAENNNNIVDITETTNLDAEKDLKLEIAETLILDLPNSSKSTKDLDLDTADRVNLDLANIDVDGSSKLNNTEKKNDIKNLSLDESLDIDMTESVELEIAESLNLDIADKVDLDIAKSLKLDPVESLNLNSTDNANLDAGAPVPLPAAAWLLISGLFSLGFMRRRKSV